MRNLETFIHVEIALFGMALAMSLGWIESPWITAASLSLGAALYWLVIRPGRITRETKTEI